MMRSITTRTIRQKKADHQPIVMTTAYDAIFAHIADEAEMDMILVGDSVANVIQGQSTTLGVTLDQMIYHCQCVAKGAQRPLIIGDMPFGSYQACVEDGIRSAVRLMKEGHCQAVKLEGGEHQVPLIRQLTLNGIPVMGHLGLTPQSVHAFGGYRVQGREEDGAQKMIQDAKRLQEAGVFALVLECIPSELAQTITESLDIPTIGIGAGPHVDGQVLVIHDLLGFNPSFKAKFVKAYASLYRDAVDALKAYREDVHKGRFPRPEHSF